MYTYVINPLVSNISIAAIVKGIIVRIIGRISKPPITG